MSHIIHKQGKENFRVIMDMVLEDLKKFIKAKQNKVEYGRLNIASKLFPTIFLEPKKFPFMREENKDGYALISNGNDAKDMLSNIVAKAYHWNKMSIGQKEVFGDEILSWILTDYGINELYLKYNDELVDEFGEISNKYVDVSHELLLREDSPFQLINTLVHEVNHRYQHLVNYFAKKSDKIAGMYPTYFSNEYAAYTQFVDNENKDNLLYRSSLIERDSNYASIKYLKKVRDVILNNLPSKRQQDLLNALDNVLEFENARILEHLNSSITLDKAFGKQRDLDYTITAWSVELCDKMKNMGDEEFDKYFNTEGYKELRKYLYFASYKMDQDTHKRLLTTLIRHNRIEAVDMVNMLDYYHTPEELDKATRILMDNTNEFMLLPSMFRYFTHIDPKEIRHACSKYLSEKDMEICERAMQNQFQEVLNAQPSLRTFNQSIDLNATDPNDYSFLLNSLFSGTFNEFARNFTPKYIYNCVVESAKMSKEKISHNSTMKCAERIIKEDILPLVNNGNLQRKDNRYIILSNEEGFSSDVTLTEEDYIKYAPKHTEDTQAEME